MWLWGATSAGSLHHHFSVCDHTHRSDDKYLLSPYSALRVENTVGKRVAEFLSWRAFFPLEKTAVKGGCIGHRRTGGPGATSGHWNSSESNRKNFRERNVEGIADGWVRATRHDFPLRLLELGGLVCIGQCLQELFTLNRTARLSLHASHVGCSHSKCREDKSWSVLVNGFISCICCLRAGPF